MVDVLRYRRVKQARKRGCPNCGHHGFKRITTDYLNRPVFQCHGCYETWTTERGPTEGTKRK